jgi:hypothetical protein
LSAPHGSGCTRNDLAGNGHFVLKKANSTLGARKRAEGNTAWMPPSGKSHCGSHSFQRMIRGSITACASLVGAARCLLATLVLLEKVVGDESAVTVTVLIKERSRNLIHQKQRIWTIFRRAKND